MASSMFDRIGGESALRSIIGDFVGRVFDDRMIGFFFRGVDRRRLKELEFQHAAAHLGGPQPYRGRPLDAAHGKHRIMGGQFARRMQILRETLHDHGVAEDIAEAWLAHDERLRPLITKDASGECD